MSFCLIINPFSSLLANNPDIYCPYYCLTCWYLVWAGLASSDVIASLISPVQVISTRGQHNTSKNVFSWRWNAYFTSDNGACLSRWDYQRFSTTSSTPSKNKSYMEPTALIGGIKGESPESWAVEVGDKWSVNEPGSSSSVTVLLQCRRYHHLINQEFKKVLQISKCSWFW